MNILSLKILTLLLISMVLTSCGNKIDFENKEKENNEFIIIKEEKYQKVLEYLIKLEI